MKTLNCPIFALPLLLSQAVTAQVTTPAQQMSVSGIRQKADCAVTGVQGNVTIYCPSGTSRSTVELLNRQFKAKLQDKDAHNTTLASEVNDWKTRYDNLLSQFDRPAADGPQTGTPSLGDDIRLKAKELLKEGKLEEAGVLLDQELGSPGTDEQLAKAHFDRASLFQLQFQPVQALPHFQKAYILRRDNPEYAAVYGYWLAKQNNFSEAEPILRKALTTARTLAKTDPHTYLPRVQLTLQEVGVMEMNSRRYEEAAIDFTEALATLRDLAKTDPDGNRPDIANSLDSLGQVYLEQGRTAEAEAVLKDSQQIYHELAKGDQFYLHDLALTDNDLGALYITARRQNEAADALTQSLAIYRTLEITEPQAIQHQLASTLHNIGVLYMEDHQYEKAGSYLKEALAIRRKLAESNPKADLPALSRSIRMMGDIYEGEGQTQQALDSFTEALAIQLDLAKSDPQVFLHEIIVTLNDMATFYSNNKHVHGLRDSLCKQASDTFITLAIPNPATVTPKIAAVCPDLAR
jgi:tetratricopeptide (TPR) repeat protein